MEKLRKASALFNDKINSVVSCFIEILSWLKLYNIIIYWILYATHSLTIYRAFLSYFWFNVSMQGHLFALFCMIREIYVLVLCFKMIFRSILRRRNEEHHWWNMYEHMLEQNPMYNSQASFIIDTLRNIRTSPCNLFHYSQTWTAKCINQLLLLFSTCVETVNSLFRFFHFSILLLISSLFWRWRKIQFSFFKSWDSLNAIFLLWLK